MNLLFYPQNIEYIQEAVDITIKNLVKYKQKYKLFTYHDIFVSEINEFKLIESNGKNLIIPLEFIKNYCNNNNQKFYIYIFTDGYSDIYYNINISDYMPENVENLFYIVIPNKNNNIKDFKNDWLNDDRFKLIDFINL